MSGSPEDVATTLGRSSVTSLEFAQWAMWIDGARLLIRNRLGDLSALDQDVLDYVVVEAVALRAKRPDAASQMTVSVDDASVTKRYESGTGQIQILDEWWELLRPSESSGAFSTRPSSARDRGRCW